MKAGDATGITGLFCAERIGELAYTSGKLKPYRMQNNMSLNPDVRNGDVVKWIVMRHVAACALATLFLMFAGCGGTPVRGNLEPHPAPSATTQAPSAAAAPVTVEATVVTQPMGHSVYRIIRVKVPKGIDSLSLVIPEDTVTPVEPSAASTST